MSFCRRSSSPFTRCVWINVVGSICSVGFYFMCRLRQSKILGIPRSGVPLALALRTAWLPFSNPWRKTPKKIEQVFKGLLLHGSFRRIPRVWCSVLSSDLALTFPGPLSSLNCAFLPWFNGFLGLTFVFGLHVITSRVSSSLLQFVCTSSAVYLKIFYSGWAFFLTVNYVPLSLSYIQGDPWSAFSIATHPSFLFSACYFSPFFFGELQNFCLFPHNVNVDSSLICLCNAWF